LMRTKDGDNRKGTPYREWLDDIKDWCQNDIRLGIEIAQDRW